jgi:hypothetical protein
MFAYLKPLAPNGDREDHLLKLSRSSEELRQLIESHPSDWEFRSWEEPGSIVLVPALLKGEEHIAVRQLFRIS